MNGFEIKIYISEKYIYPMVIFHDNAEPILNVFNRVSSGIHTCSLLGGPFYSKYFGIYSATIRLKKVSDEYYPIYISRDTRFGVGIDINLCFLPESFLIIKRLPVDDFIDSLWSRSSNQPREFTPKIKRFIVADIVNLINKINVTTPDSFISCNITMIDIDDNDPSTYPEEFDGYRIM